jgi:hypothetical protein
VNKLHSLSFIIYCENIICLLILLSLIFYVFPLFFSLLLSLEMTGRRGRYVRTDKDKIVFESRGAKGMIKDDRDATIDVNIEERKEFMSGKKLIAIISDAASTGISLHADKSVINQRPRVHITMELPWSADRAIQQLGRTHRSNERQGVLYVLCTSNLGK